MYNYTMPLEKAAHRTGKWGQHRAHSLYACSAVADVVCAANALEIEAVFLYHIRVYSRLCTLLWNGNAVLGKKYDHRPFDGK